MSNEKQLAHSKIDFETFLNFLKEIVSDLQSGILIQKVDYKLIDAVALKLIQVESKNDYVFSWLDSLFIEDKNKYERACVVLNKSIDEFMEALGYHKDWQPVTLNDELLTKDDPYWILIINKKIINRLNKKKCSLKINECIKYYFFSLHSIRERIQESNQSKNITTLSVNPLSFLREEITSLFFSIEKKALGNKPNFSAIRCAAFCELLYAKKYFKTTKLKIKTLTSFAMSKYDLDIKNSLSSSKKVDRKNHQEKIVSNDIPLRKCF